MRGFGAALFRKRDFAAGQRDKLVTVQKLDDESVGESGEPEERWDTLRMAWMSRQTMDMGENFVANVTITPYMTRWQSNYWADMDPDLLDVPKQRRLVFKGRVYNIIGAAPVDNKQAIEYLAQAGGMLT